MNLCFVENLGVAYNKFYSSKDGSAVTHTQSSVVRVFNIAKLLNKYGHSTQIIAVPQLTAGEIKKSISQSNVVIFHRIQGSKYTLVDYRYIQAVLIAVSQNKKIIFDVDDAIQITFPAISEVIAKKSSKVFAGSHALLNHYKQVSDNTYFVPSSVDTSVIKPTARSTSGSTIIGWHGSAFGHLNSIFLLSQPLKQLALKYDLVFRILGTGGNQNLQRILTKKFEGVQLDFGPPYWFPYDQLPFYMANVDIGVYPLLDNYWNMAKCSMKLLEYMALGLPSCSSSVGENMYAISQGQNGYLARTNEEWVSCLTKLIEDTDIRLKIGRQALDTISKRYSLEVTSKRVNDLLT